MYVCDEFKNYWSNRSFVTMIVPSEFRTTLRLKLGRALGLLTRRSCVMAFVECMSNDCAYRGEIIHGVSPLIR